MFATYQKVIVYFLLGFLLACSDWDLERIGFTKVITIGAIEVGSNSAFLIGDIEDLRLASITESGFVVSSTATDNQNLLLGQSDVIPVLSAGMDTIFEDRAFAARVSDLNGSTVYFFRSYIKIEGEEEVIYGNIDQFETNELNVSLKSIRRESEGCNTLVIVEVQVDGAAPVDIGLVYTTSIDNLVPTIENGLLQMSDNSPISGLYEIPLQVACGQSYFLRIVLNPGDKPVYGDDYAFTMVEGGLWEERETFPTLKKGKPVSFVNNGKGSMLGGDPTINPNISDFYEFDPSRNSWTYLNSVDSLNLSRAVHAIVDQKVYMTSGFTSLQHCGLVGNIFARDSTETSSSYNGACRDCPGSDCPWCGPLILAGSGLGTSFYSCFCLYRGMGIYDLLNGTFEYQENSPIGKRVDALPLVIEGGYFIFGGHSTIIGDINRNNGGGCLNLTRACNQSVLKFHPEAPLLMDDFPGPPRFNHVGFSTGSLAYVGLGIDCVENLIETEYGGEVTSQFPPYDEQTHLNDFYSFDPSQPLGSQWTEEASYPSTALNDRALFAFSLSNKGYVVFRRFGGPMILWQYNPDDGPGGSWKEIGDVPSTYQSDPFHLFNLGNIAYFLFPERTDNFWMYVPEL